MNKVLVLIKDNAEIALFEEALRETLTKGLELVFVHTHEEATKVLKSEKIALIFLDPHFSGAEFLGVPVIELKRPFTKRHIKEKCKTHLGSLFPIEKPLSM